MRLKETEEEKLKEGDLVISEGGEPKVAHLKKIP
jgi:hypothetical protein